uniref:Coatomer subunit delta n=2 Tax=Macrostomum lignano TaxID=282301 RepID=A0A1I8HZU1_9PLAT
SLQVLLAAAVCNKSGKTLISRQFVEMTRSRIEGLLAAFPKLMSTDKQHTFIETESVRYVYQPLEKLYVLLLTTKASNILEDLETLRLFARVIPEYSSGMEEKDLLDNAFQLIFAFDEIVALGYRESVNLAQIKTFTEMDSHEEKVFLAVRVAQEKEAKAAMRAKAKELTLKNKEMRRAGGGGGGGRMAAFGGGGGMGGGSGVGGGGYVDTTPTLTSTMPEPNRARPAAQAAGGGKAMKLGSRAKQVDYFVDQLKEEGEQLVDTPAGGLGAGRAGSSAAAAAAAAMPAAQREAVHLRLEEKFNCEAGRGGGVSNLELTGLLHITCANEDAVRLHLVQASGPRARAVQVQTHPNIDKKVFQTNSWIQMKAAGRGFPVNQEANVVKWRMAGDDEALLPLTINCWPNQAPSGSYEVTVEYELTPGTPRLENVLISIPLPQGAQTKVNQCDGDYRVDARKSLLEWSLPLIDPEENPTGNLDLLVGGGGASEDSFFPVGVMFTSQQSLVGIDVDKVVRLEGDSPVKFSVDRRLVADNFRVV